MLWAGVKPKSIPADLRKQARKVPEKAQRQREDALIDARIRFELLLDAFGIRGFRRRQTDSHPSSLSDEEIGRYEVHRALSPYAQMLQAAHQRCRSEICDLLLPLFPPECDSFLAWVLEKAPWFFDFTQCRPAPETITAISQIIWMTDLGVWNHDPNTPGLRPLLWYSVGVLDFIWRQRSVRGAHNATGRRLPAQANDGNIGGASSQGERG